LERYICSVFFKKRHFGAMSGSSLIQMQKKNLKEALGKLDNFKENLSKK